MSSNKFPISRKDNIVVQELDGEVLIYDLNNNKAFCLNETSALVWEMCDGNKSTTEISKSIAKKLNSPANEDIVWLALDQLKNENLIENEIATDNYFNGMSRREVIKKVGLGTMIALPLVIGITAPKAVHAASCDTTSVATRGTCTCSFAQNHPTNGGAIGSVCDTSVGPGGMNNCLGGCQPRFAQAGNAVCICS